MITMRLIISGRVQGVGFRWFVQRQADVLGVTGYAKNLPDGTVEVAACGEKEKLGELLLYCRTGPRASRVNNIHIEWGDAKGVPNEFTVR